MSLPQIAVEASSPRPCFFGWGASGTGAVVAGADARRNPGDADSAVRSPDWLNRGGHPGGAGPAPAWAERACHPAQGERPLPDPERGLRRAHPGHAHRDPGAQRGPPLGGLLRDGDDLSAQPRGLHLPGQIRHPRLAGRRALQRARNRRPRRRRRNPLSGHFGNKIFSGRNFVTIPVRFSARAGNHCISSILQPSIRL